jgi:diguanylate cyclase
MDTLVPLFRITSTRQVFALLAIITLISVAVPVLSIATALAVIPGLPAEAYWAILLLAGIIPLLIAPPIAIGALSILRLLTETLNHLDDCVRYDPLTGVLSRVYLLSMVRQRVVNGGSFLMIDADHFKSVNDTYGHDIGDEALKCLANVLKTSLPAEALVGRLGGEEFGAFLPRQTSSEAGAVAESLCAAMRQFGRNIAGHELSLTISVGISQHRPESTLEQTMKSADEALYHAKRSGRDRCHIAVPRGEMTVPETKPAERGDARHWRQPAKLVHSRR